MTVDASATLLCPHGGQVTIVPSNATITAGSPVTVQSDTMTIVGCTFTLPGGAPSPCVQVQWVSPDTRVTVNGTPTLSLASTGLCLSAAGAPQGAVVIASTQSRCESI